MSTPAYQQVVTVPATPVTRSSSDWRRQGVQIGKLVIGVPLVACLASFGGVMLLSGISMVSIFADNDYDSHDVIGFGVVMIIVGCILVVSSIKLCVSFVTKTNSGGRVITTNVGPSPTVNLPTGVVAYPASHAPTTTPALPPGSYPVQPPVGPYQHPSSAYGPLSAQQYNPYPQPGQAGQYPGPPAPGAYPPPGAAAAPYPYLQPAQATSYPGPPATAGPYPYPAQPPYAPPDLLQAPSLPPKGELPGEVHPSAPHDPYEKPPPYAP